jgi:hypothetical protein
MAEPDAASTNPTLDFHWPRLSLDTVSEDPLVGGDPRCPVGRRAGVVEARRHLACSGGSCSDGLGGMIAERIEEAQQSAGFAALRRLTAARSPC